MLFGVLDRYIGRTVLASIMMTLFTLTSLSGIIKFVDQLRKIDQGSYSPFAAGIYTLLCIPQDAQIFFPMATLLGALLGLGKLANYSELVVMQVTGFSRMQIAISVMKVAMPLALLVMATGEWISPRAEQMARNYQAQMIYGGSLLSTQSGLWAKDGMDFIYIERILSDRELSGISIYHFDRQYRLQSVRYAAAAVFENHGWQLFQTHELDLRYPEKIQGTQHLSGEWSTSLTPDKLRVVAMSPEYLSISGLNNYIRYLKQGGQESRRYQLSMWSKIFAPFSIAVMVLMALSFIFGPLRAVSVGIRILTGISVGFIFYVLDKIFGTLSLVYSVPPVIGALLPAMLFLFISIYLLLRHR